MRKSFKIVLLLLCFATIAFLFIPVPQATQSQSSVLYSREGRLLGAKIADDQQWRFPELDSVPVKFESAILNFEDEYFYFHPGINPISLCKALVRNIKAGRIVSGGSTLSMQWVRICRQNPSRTISEKLLEMILTLRVELSTSKKEILKKYASHAPFGGNVVGLEAASWRYYGRSPYQLSWAESACLAVLPNAPSLIRPGKNIARLKVKRDQLLAKMYRNGVIDSLQYELALLEKLPNKPYDLPRKATHLLEYLVGAKSGQKYYSCIDYQLQERVSRLAERHHRHLVMNEIHNLSAIVLKIETGEVLSYFGNVESENNAEHGCDVDIIHAARSSGSILKPFLYALMLDQGEILPEALIADIPTQIQGYAPKNYNRKYDGAVPASKALARSLNVPAVHMLKQFGVGRFLDYLQKMNFTDLSYSADHYGLSLILGGAETSLWDLAGAYSSLGRTLKHYNTYSSHYRKQDFHPPVLEMKNVEDISPSDFIEGKIKLGAGSIYYTLDALLKVNRPENESGWESFSSSSKVAWKTGTSFGYRDAWAVGLTGDYLVAVWAGNADGEGRPGLTGVTAAAPLMFDIFDLLPQSDWYEKPLEDLESISVCRESGCRASAICPYVDTLDVPQSGLKTAVCSYHKLVHLDKDGRYQVSSDCIMPHDMTHKAWFVLPPVWEWYYKLKHPLYKSLPPYMEGCSPQGEIPMMQFVFPMASSVIYLPMGLDGKIQSVVFEIAHRQYGTKIYWHLDEEYLGETVDIHQMEILTDSGEHIVTAVDENGNRIIRKVLFVNKYQD
ncbi:penicillin-binding protein 1C [Ancylomarina salipaludis]|uniref:peptidoglycan glycosyltransferase n=1 Tax=Ancylomarina salipaludis TaxID=2501299 RepID=A0A4Q1JQ93_9BACT|nr:penicillin-binding protein 1C [Ancylomarina salipaludis]RXQ97604.1 penicillin-binding protein 1C [Ancylomarina salipaludis]